MYKERETKIARLTKEQLNALKKKYNVDRIWSYSRISKFEACPVDYVATYLWHMDLAKGNIYSFMGSQFHQEMEDFYNHEIGYDDLYKQWSKFVTKWEMTQHVTCLIL